jgi:hypothetical protein
MVKRGRKGTHRKQIRTQQTVCFSKKMCFQVCRFNCKMQESPGHSCAEMPVGHTEDRPRAGCMAASIPRRRQVPWADGQTYGLADRRGRGGGGSASRLVRTDKRMHRQTDGHYRAALTASSACLPSASSACSFSAPLWPGLRVWMARRSASDRPKSHVLRSSRALAPPTACPDSGFRGLGFPSAGWPCERGPGAFPLTSARPAGGHWCMRLRLRIGCACVHAVTTPHRAPACGAGAASGKQGACLAGAAAQEMSGNVEFPARP